jgi:hypothetical protein
MQMAMANQTTEEVCGQVRCAVEKRAARRGYQALAAATALRPGPGSSKKGEATKDPQQLVHTPTQALYRLLPNEQRPGTAYQPNQAPSHAAAIGLGATVASVAPAASPGQC